MASELLPPGFRFHPTDEELVGYYLKRKVCKKPFVFETIAEVDLYKFAPWDLPEKSCLQSRDLEWFFFCPRDKKYSNGGRTNRATEIGYWKTTGKDRPILSNSRTVGMKKTLVFHLGRAPRGDRTDWVMHEYRLEDDRLANSDILQDAFVLCRIFQKSGPGPKNGEQYGAPFREEDWDEELVNSSAGLFPAANDVPILPEPVIDQTVVIPKKEPEFLLQHDAQPSDVFGTEEQYSSKNSPANDDDDDDGIYDLLLQLPDPEDVTFTFDLPENDYNDKIEAYAPPNGSSAGHIAIPDGGDIFNGLGDITNGSELEGIDKFLLPNNQVDGSFMDQMFNGNRGGFYLELNDLHQPMEAGSYLELNDLHQPMEAGSYLELNDLHRPMEAGASEIEMFSYIENPMNFNNQLIPLTAVVMPAPARDTYCPSFEGSNSFMDESVIYRDGELPNWEYQSAIQDLDASSYIRKENSGNECIKQPIDGGEECEESSDIKHISNGGGSVSKLQSLLGSIPASPASAAEYPISIKGGMPVQKYSAYGSGVHFAAAVSITHICTKDGLLDSRSGDLSCASCRDCKPLVESARRKPGQGASSGGFIFVFLLGVISALMWVFLLAISAKLGRYVWKSLLP